MRNEHSGTITFVIGLGKEAGRWRLGVYKAGNKAKSCRNSYTASIMHYYLRTLLLR
ncbi:hypothetical protein [Chryseobacterium sp. HR92]|uniref:hypothetical protein n=1 Tax=Chryseobacterium sp. HR92 TaxID=3094839 RepID=UPI00388D9E74|nr:hypothetical protein SFA27_00215 [Chryseobacterium sp. HR92]